MIKDFYKYYILTLDSGCLCYINQDNLFNVLYCFVVDGEIKYIGKTNNLKKRFSYYRNGIKRLDQHTDYTNSKKLYEAINMGLKVELYIRNIYVESALSYVEKALIKIYQPEWNRMLK